MTHMTDEQRILAHIEKASRQSETLRQLREYDEAIQAKLEAIYDAEELQHYDLENAKSEGKKAMKLQELRYERMIKEQYYEIIVLAEKCGELRKAEGAIVYHKYQREIEDFKKQYEQHMTNVNELERQLTNA